MDDEIAGKTNRWSPWDFRPACAYPANASMPKYCVYSYCNFRGESGIAFLTSPDYAAALVDYLPDPDPLWEKWKPKFPPERELLGPPYEIRDMPGKGKGVVANRTIRAREVVMSNLPVIVKLMTLPVSIHRLNRQQVLQRGFDQLPMKDRERVMELAYGAGDGTRLENIIRTNVFNIAINGESNHAGLFPEISRMNHACKPNCITRFSRRTLRMEAVAYRDIEPGEELTISYTPLNLMSEDRQELIRGWGFNCTCSLCASKQESKASDFRRQRIQDILNELDQPEDREHVTRLADEVLFLIEKEGLVAQQGDFYNILAQVFLDMGYPKAARLYGSMAAESLREYVGEDSGPALKALKFLVDLNKQEHG